MNLALLLLTGSVLAAIALQDFMNRAFYWFFLPLLFVLGFIRGSLSINLQFWVVITGINICVVSLILIALLIYNYIRNKKLRLVNAMGLGDILLFFSLTSLLLPMQYLLIIIISSIFAILFFMLSSAKSSDTKIPLAGWLCVSVAVFTLFDTFGLISIPWLMM
jgi:hypothetical protein